MRDWLFSAVTLQRTRNSDMLSIVVSNVLRTFPETEPIFKRCISSRHYHRHPLFPILVIADSALEDYLNIYDDILEELSDKGHPPLPCHQHAEPVLNPEDPAARLAYITGRRERLNYLSGDLKGFHASVRNLLTLPDGANVEPGSPQSPSGQSAVQTIPMLPLDSMLYYLVSASGDILERMSTTDTRLQHAFLVVRLRGGQTRLRLF